MPFEAADRFFHALNPQKHFAPLYDEHGNKIAHEDPRRCYRVSSATFKYKAIGKSPKRWESSLDWERLMPLQRERARLRERFPGYGLGALTFASISEVGAEVELKPELDNPAHCALYATAKEIDELIKPEHLVLIDWPTKLL